jgi:serine/threonine-protein kinase
MGSHRIVVGVLSLILVIGTVAEGKTTATVTCADGTTSKPGRGACSHHGGLASARSGANAPASKRGAPKAPVAAAANADDAAGATAKCKDGTYSHSTHNGACANHRGVKEWLDGSGQ